MKKSAYFLIGILVFVFLVIFLTKGSGASYENIDAVEEEIIIYKSITCGCCGIYANYASSKVSPKVNTVDMTSLDSIKSKYGIPRDLESCHTTIVGDYFVEGHIPLEAVDKLIKEQPDIAGIAMPGMPSGSPGMPGQKYGDFIIYAVGHNGSYSEFMRI